MNDVLLDVAEIVDARAAGATYAELTARFGRGPCALKNILGRHGLDGSPKMRHRIPRETKAEMVAMSRQGMSHTAIATATGWSRGAVERVLRDWGDLMNGDLKEATATEDTQKGPARPKYRVVTRMQEEARRRDERLIE